MSGGRLDMLIAELTRPVSMPECETAAAAGNDEPSFDELTFDRLTEEYTR